MRYGFWGSPFSSPAPCSSEGVAGRHRGRPARAGSRSGRHACPPCLGVAPPRERRAPTPVRRGPHASRQPALRDPEVRLGDGGPQDIRNEADLFEGRPCRGIPLGCPDEVRGGPERQAEEGMAGGLSDDIVRAEELQGPLGVRDGARRITGQLRQAGPMDGDRARAGRDMPPRRRRPCPAAAPRIRAPLPAIVPHRGGARQPPRSRRG